MRLSFWSSDREPRPPHAKRAALWMYAVPLIPGAVIIWLLLTQWNRDGSVPQVEQSPRGTIGTSATPGGFDPGPRPESTREELKLRGVASPPQGPMPPLGDPELTGLAALFLSDAHRLFGRRISVRNVEVTEADGPTSFSIRQGPATAHVVASPNLEAVRIGMRVDVSGVVESDGAGGVRVRADSVHRRDGS
jgi:hypothetical protein